MVGITGKRILLTIHILFNGVWMGGLAAIVFLNTTKGSVFSGDQLSAVNQILFRIHDVVVMNIGFGVIVTGLLFSLFTRWGFFDFYWVIVKWIGLIVVFLLITFFLAPVINGMAALSDVQGQQALNDPQYLAYEQQTTLVSTLLLALLTVITGVSVFKPWGPRKKPFNANRKAVLATGISLGVLVIGGTILQSMQLEVYRRVTIHDIDLALIEEGRYIGEVDFGVKYAVEVNVKNHKIKSMNILSDRSGFYTRLAEGVIGKVLKAQTPNVVAVTGATTSSKGLMKAIEHALQQRLTNR
jgi:uncharacterized protein with FMN-binding domain